MDYRHHVNIMSLCLSVIDMMFDIVWFIKALLSLRLRVRTSLAHPYYLRLHVHPCSTLDIMSTSCPHAFQCRHHVGDQHYVPLVCHVHPCSTLDFMSTLCRRVFSCRPHVVVKHHVDIMLVINIMFH